MRRVVIGLVLLAACRSAGTPVSGGSASSGSGGAGTPRAAVEQFLAAAKAQDMQALSNVWGDKDGLLRDKIGRPELERRSLISLCLLKHDQSRIADPTTGLDGGRIFNVDLTQGNLEASIPFTVVQGRSARWYVQNFDLTALQHKGFCSMPSKK